MATPASSRISSLAKIVAPVRSASAIESEGRGADFLAVGEDQVGEEDPVPQRGDVHRRQADIQGGQHVAYQVVSQRPLRHHALLREGDRGRLHRSDPDRQVPLPLHLLQQDDGVIRRHLNPDADDLHLPHSGSVLACA